MDDARLLCSEDIASDLKLPSVGGFTMGCLRERLQAVLTREWEAAGGGSGGGGAGRGQDDGGQQLSKRCVQAMFKRQVSGRVTTGVSVYQAQEILLVTGAPCCRSVLR